MRDRNPQDFEHQTRLNRVDLGGKEAANVPNIRTGILVLHAYKIHKVKDKFEQAQSTYGEN
jgi:hypothetical protein